MFAYFACFHHPINVEMKQHPLPLNAVVFKVKDFKLMHRFLFPFMIFIKYYQRLRYAEDNLKN